MTYSSFHTRVGKPADIVGPEKQTPGAGLILGKTSTKSSRTSSRIVDDCADTMAMAIINMNIGAKCV